MSNHNQRENLKLQDENFRYVQMTSILDLPITEDRQSHDDKGIPELSFAVRRLTYAAKLLSGKEF